MADSLAQREVEAWIVAHELPRRYGAKFSKKRMPLTWGGEFECDAVSRDGQTIVCISTSCCKTASGRSAVGKFHKIKADALYLTNIKAGRRILVFTDAGMHDHFVRERSRGRFPTEETIEIALVGLPVDLAGRLSEGAAVASREVSPMPSLGRVRQRP